MAVPVLKSSLIAGEISPSLWGHVDFAKFSIGASTLRNFFVNYHGGAYSRAGTAFCGFSKQTGRQYPPRIIPFQFSIKQGLALEFGNFYMRVLSNGGFVTESPFVITAATQSNPATVTVNPSSSAVSATSNNGAVSASYTAGDTVTLTGGTFSTAAVLLLHSTSIVSLAINARGTGYKGGDVITLAGGSPTIAGRVVVTTTRVLSATLVDAGAGLTNGAAVATGTTGSGTRFQINVTIAGGIVTVVGAFVTQGSYTTNPANLAAEPLSFSFTAGGREPTLSLVMEIATVALTVPGSYTVNSAALTQASTTGSGTGATFNLAVFGPNALTVATPGSYTVIPGNPVAQGSSSGAGVGATFNLVWVGASALVTGDWVAIAGMQGMTQLNSGTYVVNVAGSVLSLFDVYGNPIDSTGFGTYTGGGTASRIYTLATPYSEQDLDYLKFTQSADVMTICCVNQATLTEYQEVDLSRLADNNWVFSTAVAVPTVTAPTAASGSASSAGTVDYQYVVTAVSHVDGSESQASPIAEIYLAVNVASTAGTITITWTGVIGVNEYNVYKAQPGNSTPPPAGALFGFAGSAYGTQFLDSNIVADFAQVPPLHKNPFARGQIIAVNPIAQGSGYTTAVATISSLVGSGAIFNPVIVGGAIVAYIQKDAGSGYQPTDTISVTGDGTGATASLTVGPETGTYPSVVAYFQQRRAFANTLNQPDAYFMSQPGAFNNFDSRIPTIDSDAITGTPWSVEINGIQWLLPMPGGLVAFTGLSVWQVNGAGSSSFNPLPITPSSQSAVPQSSIGASVTVPPIKIESDIIYVQAKNSEYLDATYQIYTNNYSVNYITLNSTQLFQGFTIRQHAWCEQPFKTLWAARSDGAMLSLTYLKAQEIQGWARHDTNGLFVSVCSVTEPPVDALYVAVERFPPTWSASQRTFMIERMDDRIWSTVENCWCVDCGFSLGQPTPAANLAASSAAGAGQITGYTNLVGGAGYSAATTAFVVDDNGKGVGIGAIPTLTIVGGVITNITFPANSGYVRPMLVITDPAGSAGGSGASARLTLDNSATFTASAPVFSGGNVGSVIRMGGGIATITGFTDSQHVTANISVPITQVIQNGSNTPQTVLASNWTMTAPVTMISGLRPLAGLAVTGLADGVPIPPTVVNALGQITLAIPASSVTIGLAFKPQLQTVYLDAGEPTVQGSRKKIGVVTARVEASGSFMIGSNQPDGSIQSPIQISMPWQLTVADVTAQPDKAQAAYNAVATPLWTGDLRIPVSGGFNTHGQVAIQQDLPLPLQILALIPEVLPGDNPATTAPQKPQARK